MMKLALVAHNNKKEEILSIVDKYKELLEQCTLFSTRQTGEMIENKFHIKVNKVKSGPTGGDIEIANMVVDQKLDVLIFLIDPLSSHCHENDIQSLVRLSILDNVVLATNYATACTVLDFLSKHLN
ncbi:hypothetical protein A3O11_07005 [Ligilactobacillus aviarius]|nr:hypothetical protein A3O10_06370 [Ligilactobacillus aviarius]OAQ03254.1 hypothetical protein A3O11_07005 [Ligilactobacillus aviarius]OAQ08044.1 hypothetical protein A3O15_00325 [Ligilactobacillus aviarius]OAS76824.1 hypothetical protein A3O17_03810 [Ligilactobacillus aviarius]OAS78844.1 hypothetical protein A3O18_06210 [Ligilactobacillus aviarius]